MNEREIVFALVQKSGLIGVKKGDKEREKTEEERRAHMRRKIHHGDRTCGRIARIRAFVY